MNPKPLVSIVIPSYNSRRYIEKCLDSILVQEYPNYEIFIVINGNEDGSADLIKEKYYRFKKILLLEPGENLWFSRGHNLAMQSTQGKYFLALNQDTVMEKDFLSRLVAVLEADSTLGSVTGKLLHYKFDIDSKTKILDSTGIEMYKTRRVIDRGQWEIDNGQYDLDTEVFGASGAAALYRRTALEEVKLPKTTGGFEYYDEDFIAYKEDVDLAWRLQLAGYRCRYVPEAVIYHGRSIGRSWPTQFIRFILNRRRQPRQVRRLSFKNHYLMMVKNETLELFWRHGLFILGREILLFIYTFLFEQFQILAIMDFFRQLPEARRKRQLIMAKKKVHQEFLAQIFH